MEVRRLGCDQHRLVPEPVNPKASSVRAGPLVSFFLAEAPVPKRAPEKCLLTEQTKVLSHGSPREKRFDQRLCPRLILLVTKMSLQVKANGSSATSKAPSATCLTLILDNSYPALDTPTSLLCLKKCQDHAVLLDFALSVSSAPSPDSCLAKPFPLVFAHMPLTGRAFLPSPFNTMTILSPHLSPHPIPIVTSICWMRESQAKRGGQLRFQFVFHCHAGPSSCLFPLRNYMIL